MSLLRGPRALTWRLTIGMASAAAVLALVGCGSAAAPVGAPAQVGAASPPVSAPTRFPVVDALLAAARPTSASPTTPPAASVAPTSPVATAPGATTSPPPTTRPAAPPAQVAVAAGRIRPGVVYSGRATEHDAGAGDGNCLLGPSDDMLVVAMNEVDYDNARSCGAFLEVTGPGGSTVVKVVDRCPECPVGALDLSQQAFARIAGGAQGGLDKVSWRLLSPANIGPVQFFVKKESSQWWVSLQVRNHRNPIASLEVMSNGSWVAVPRQMYNFFEQEGFGAGPFTVRITDIYGQQLVCTVNLTPGSAQTTNVQFAQH